MKSLGKSTHELFVCDKPNHNNRIYTRKELEKAVEEYQDKIDTGHSFGILGAPNGVELELSKVSHKVNKLYFDEDKVIADIEILNTPSGQLCFEMFDKLKLVSSGVGNLNEDNEVVDYVLHGTFFTEEF